MCKKRETKWRQIGGVRVLTVDRLRGRRQYMVSFGTQVTFLTEREFEVLSGMGAGQSVRQIAASLGIAVSTAEGHLLAVRQNFGLKSKHDLMMLVSDQAGQCKEVHDGEGCQCGDDVV